MPSVQIAQDFNAKVLAERSTSATIPVALFVGGTSGIGQGAVEAFAKYTNGNAHVIICGRNRQGERVDSANEVIVTDLLQS